MSARPLVSLSLNNLFTAMISTDVCFNGNMSIILPSLSTSYEEYSIKRDYNAVRKLGKKEECKDDFI